MAHIGNRVVVPLVAALALVLAALAYAGWRVSRATSVLPVYWRGSRAGSAYEPMGWADMVAAVGTWSEPVAQGAGPGWTYEVFSPPAVFRDPASGDYVVRIPGHDEAAPGNESAPVKDAVVDEPFPLKLVGFFGSEDRGLGAFENVRTGEHFLAGAGQSLPKLGLTVMEFTIRPAASQTAAGAVIGGLVATAVIADDLTGEQTRLTDQVSALEAMADAGDGVRAVPKPPSAGPLISDREIPQLP